jgi:hypothetical protein
MKTAAPVASVLLIAALIAAIVWQAVSIWRPHNFVLPALINQSTAPATSNNTVDSPQSPIEPRAATNGSAINFPQQAATPELAHSSSLAKAAGPVVDETALRYFARQGDTRRLNAEIARLRSLYPDWTPPSDPLQVPVVTDPQLDNLWRLYAQGQFAQTRAAIAERQTADPKWSPPKDLTEQLDLADARERLINASSAKQYETVIQIAASAPSLRTCGDVDVLWRVAEAFAATNRESRALDAYRYILTNCKNERERLATVQKAVILLPRHDVDELLSLGHTGAGGPEFQSVREDIARHAVAAAGSESSAKVDNVDLSVLEKIAEDGRSPSDPLLLGWYWLRHGDAAKAERWFRKSYERENGVDSAQGLALALVALKRPADAEAALAPWRDTNVDSRKTYLSAAANLLSAQPPPIVSAEVLTRIVQTTSQGRDPAVAQLLGWYSHAFKQDDTAARWFATSLAWKPDDEPSAFGLAIADLSLDRRAALQSLERNWRGRSPRIAALTDPTAARALASASPSTPASEEPVSQASSESAAQNVQQPSGASQIGEAPLEARTPAPSAKSSLENNVAAPSLSQAWRLMQLQRPAEAAAIFRESLARGSSKERENAAYGLALAYLEQKLPVQADTAAALSPQTDDHSRELKLSILTERVRQAYDAGKYRDVVIGLDSRDAMAPEPVDLMSLRAWSYFHLHRYEEAEQIFDALAAAGDEDAARAAAIAKTALSNGREGVAR